MYFDVHRKIQIMFADRLRHDMTLFLRLNSRIVAEKNAFLRVHPSEPALIACKLLTEGIERGLEGSIREVLLINWT